MKKILFSSLLGVALIGCGSGSSGGFDYDDLIPDSSSSNVSASEALKISATSDGYNIKWKRTGQAKYGSYTALILKNAQGTYKIASTNNNRTLHIKCVLESKSSQRYECDGGIDVMGAGGFILTSGSNVFYERAGNSQDDKTIKLPASL